MYFCISLHVIIRISAYLWVCYVYLCGFISINTNYCWFMFGVFIYIHMNLYAHMYLYILLCIYIDLGGCVSFEFVAGHFWCNRSKGMSTNWVVFDLVAGLFGVISQRRLLGVMFCLLVYCLTFWCNRFKEVCWGFKFV